MSRLLSPLGALYAAGVRRRLKAGPRIVAKIPVICVGNLTVGGSGKTPSALALGARLSGMDQRPHFISRGYGRTGAGQVRVDPLRHDAASVGDEPLLLAACAPTWVGGDRAASVAEAAAAGATAAILDDGHQDSALACDLSVVVADAGRGFGNGRVLPAGPLREPVRAGLARADLLLLIGSDAARAEFLGRWRGQIPVPVTSAETVPVKTGADWRSMRVMAFAGIAHPEKFFSTLAGLGADIAHAVTLSDHAPLSERLLRRLAAAAERRKAVLVTTEKDAVRLPAGWRRRILSLPVRLRFHDQSVIDRFLKLALSRRETGHSPSDSSSNSESCS